MTEEALPHEARSQEKSDRIESRLSGLSGMIFTVHAEMQRILNWLKQDAGKGVVFNIPKASGEMTIILWLAILSIVSLVVNGLNYARMARDDEMLKLAEDRAAKAETDLKTQIWLRSDSLTKENASLLAEIRTTQGLVQAYGISKQLEKRK